MSTPKKIRSAYEITFKRLVNTSPASKKFRQFLSSMRNPAKTFNLPITLEDVRTRLLAPLEEAKKAKRKSAKRAKPAAKKAKARVKTKRKTTKTTKGAAKKTRRRTTRRKK